MSDVTAESSSAPTTPAGSPAAVEATPASSTVQIPTDAEWRRTGKSAVAPKPKAAESASAKESSESDSDESAAASEAADTKQEKRERPRSNAETRLREMLDDLKRAGLTPAELKTFKRQAQAEAAEAPKTEHTDKPAAAKVPTYDDQHPKPRLEDFDSIEAHTEALTDWKLDKRDFERAQREQAVAQQKAISDALSGAKARYGEDAESSIRSAAKEIASDESVPAAVKDILGGSDVLTDVLYTLNSKAGDLAEFIALAKSNPAAAIRKAVLLEHLVRQELSSKGEDASEPGRDESGQFVKKAPAKRVTEAPPPPREASGRSSAPPDEQATAFKAGDFESFRSSRNRADVARQQGR